MASENALESGKVTAEDFIDEALLIMNRVGDYLAAAEENNRHIAENGANLDRGSIFLLYRYAIACYIDTGETPQALREEIIERSGQMDQDTANVYLKTALLLKNHEVDRSLVASEQPAGTTI